MRSFCDKTTGHVQGEDAQDACKLYTLDIFGMGIGGGEREERFY